MDLDRTRFRRTLCIFVAGFMVLPGYFLLIPLDSMVVRADQGGPDQYGYIWTDSNPPAPQVTYSWEEISLTGVTVGPLGDDDEYGPFPIGFDFNFYGELKTTFYISNDGAVSFNASNIPPSNTQIPNGVIPNDLIAVLWDDLDSETGSIFYETRGLPPNRYLVVEWYNMNHFSNLPGTVTFEMILYESSNLIKFQYQEVCFDEPAFDFGASATVGIENATGAIGLQYSYDSPVIANGTAIEFSKLPNNIAVRNLEAPDHYYLNNQFYVNATVVNNGENPENSLEVNFSVNGILEAQDFILTLDPGNSYDASYQYTPTQVIDYLVEIAVTPVPGETYTKDNNQSKLVTQDKPTFGNPILDPIYPNASVPVNVSMPIYATYGVSNATLWFSYDNVSWFSVPMSFPEPPLFRDAFDSTTLDPAKWADWGGTDGPEINDLGIEEPSEPYSLDLDSDDYINSTVIDISAQSDLSVNFWYEAGGGGEMPDLGNFVHLQCYHMNGTWMTLWTEEGGAWETEYTNVDVDLPIGYYHWNFQFRFVAEGNIGFDDWFIDEVIVGKYVIPCANIPAPGFSTTVYFYVNATGMMNNTNESTIHTYYADGTPPEIHHQTSISGVVPTNEPVQIFTNTSDDFMLDYGLLWYDNGSGWTSLPMWQTWGNQTLANYSAVIPGQSTETIVFYYTEVFDIAGNSNVSATLSYVTNFPPGIADIQYDPPSPGGSSQVTISANITDTNGIDTATLYYSFDGGAAYSPVAMTPVAASTYEGDVPPFGTSGWVYCYINATDNLGLLTTSSVFSYYVDATPPDFEVPYISPRYPDHLTDVNVTVEINEYYGVNDATLWYSYDGTTWNSVPMSMTGGVTTYSYDVESGSSGWIHYPIAGPAGDTWVISSSRSNSPVNSWYSGPEQGPVWGDACLESPWMNNIPLGGKFSFWHWYDFQSPWDGGMVELYDGSSWTQIYPEDGYDTTLGTGYQNPLEGMQAFTGYSGGWKQDVFDISAYAGTSIELRFHVGWDDFDDPTDEGWYIDDVMIYTDPGNWYGSIPSPAYPTWVDYYIEATDAAGNSNSSVTYSYLAASDLVMEAQNITFIPGSPMDNGTTATINASIYNNGGSLSGVEVRFYLGDPDSDNDNVLDAGAVQIGSSQTIDVPAKLNNYAETTWTVPTNGSFEIYVWADPLNNSWEWNEFNNLAGSTLSAFQWVDNFEDESRVIYIDNVTIRNGDARPSGGNINIGLVNQSAYRMYEILLNSINDTYNDITMNIEILPADPSPADLAGHDLVIFDGWSSLDLSEAEIFNYTDYYNQGGSLWISYDDVSSYAWNESFETLIGALEMSDTPDSEQTTITSQFYPNGAPIDVYGEIFDFGQTDQENVTAGTCVYLDSAHEITLLDGGGKYVMYLGDTVESVSNFSAGGMLGRFFTSFLNMSKLGGGESGTLISQEIILPADHLWDILYIDKTLLPNTFINVTILDGSTEEPIPGFENLTGSVIDIFSINPQDHPTLKLQGNFVGGESGVPRLHHWAVDWVYLMADAGADFSVDEDVEFELNGGGSQSSGGIVDYQWDIDESDGLDWGSPDCTGVINYYTYSDPGTYVITLKVTDIYGNWAMDNVNITVIDRTLPVADAGPDNSTEVNIAITLDASGSWDNIGVVTYMWDWDDSDDVDWVTPDKWGMKVVNIYDTVGTYTATVRVEDAQGNWATDTVNITIYDSTLPIVQIGDDRTVDEDTSVSFSSTGTQDNSNDIIWYNWTFGDGGTMNGTTYMYQHPTYRFSNPGIFTVTLTVSDSSGNINSTSITVIVNDKTNPSADAGLDDETDEDVYYDFNGTGSTDNSGEIIWYNWTFGDGNTKEGSDPAPSYRYLTPGVYTVTLRVADAAGLWDEDIMKITVLDATDPVANAGTDDSVNEDEEYQFDGSDSSDNVNIVRWYWDIDESDGADWDSPDLNGISPKHTYEEPGQYIVTLRAEDAEGNYDTDTVRITVNAVEGPDSMPPASPSDLEVTLVADGEALELSWDAPVMNEDGTTLTDLDHYEVWYRRGTTGSFRKADDVDASRTVYTHTDLTNLKEYFYYIVAVDMSGNPSAPSDTETGTPDEDTDLDGIGNAEDLDDDDDGHPDDDDAYPLDPDKWKKEETGEGIPWLYLILVIVIVVIVVILVLVMMMRKKEKGVDFTQEAPQQPQVAPPAPPAAAPAPPVPPPSTAATMVLQPPVAAATPPAPPPPATAVPPPKAQAGTLPPPPKPAAPGGQKIKCPKCAKIFPVTSEKRPFEIQCPHCGQKGVIK